MLVRNAFAASLIFALAACGGSDQDGDAENGEVVSMEDAAELARNSRIRPEPGQYSARIEVLDIDMPGAPDGAAEMMRSMMSTTTMQYCLTQDDVENGFEQMARQSQEGDCVFERFEIDGGRFDGRMICNVQGRGNMTMTMHGQGTPTSSTVDTTMEGDMGGMGQARIRMRATHERIGECQ